MTEINKKNPEKSKKNYNELEVETGVNRRKFLGLMGASMALAGMTTTGCIRRPKEYIYPNSKQPENLLPGVPKNYSTTALIAGSVLGLTVTSTDGRPTKIDGNYKHFLNNPIPQSKLGSSNSFAQAEILNLYDPNRGQNCTSQGKITDKSIALKEIKNLVTLTKKQNGKNLAVVYETNSSASFTKQLSELQNKYPESYFVDQDTTYSSNRLEGLKLVTNENVDLFYDLTKATTILAIDSDFLGLEGDSVKNARQFSHNRQVINEQSSMNRLYSVESSISITGSISDHRYTLHSQLMGDLLISLLKELNLNSISIPDSLSTNLIPKAPLENNLTKWIKAVSKDLAAHKNQCVVIVGDKQPAWVHALGFAINTALGAISSGIISIYPTFTKLNSAKTMAQLNAAVNNNLIETIIIIGGNPVYSQAADIEFNKLISKIPNSVYLGLSPDETAQMARIYLPQTHFLESWGDSVSTNGVLSIRQPLIAPLFENSVNENEFLSYLLNEKPLSDFEIIRSFLNPISETNWRTSLADGFVKDWHKPTAQNYKFNFSSIAKQYEIYPPLPNPTLEKLNIQFVLDRSLYDGRYANNSWLQELADPIYKLVWDNALLVSPKTAKALGIKGRPKPGTSEVDVVKVTYNKRTLEAAVWEVPGIADFTLVLPLGYGRSFGEVAQGSGFNANLIRTSKSWFGSKVTISKTGLTYSLVSSQEYELQSGTPHLKEDRPPVVREATFEHFKNHPNFVLDHELIPIEEQRNNLFKYPSNPTQQKWARQQWGMTIDLNTCIGCNACSVACQAENNISVVGKTEVFKNREMSWIRIDRYFNGDTDNPDVRTVFQPMNCQHCENAPCEAVCPVAATVHSPDGLNDMAYNRCVGTRYCANNCPYKVRRYNFFNYSKIDDERNPLYAMQKNPNVTVRFRGVMEKCTYCVQKINSAKINANKISTDGLVADGAIITACQSVCPTNSIVFGDVADPKSQVSKLKAISRNYSVLGELNVKPRTTYLAKLRNVNPDI